MKKLIIVLLPLLITCGLNAQPSKYWGGLTPGDYKVGYQDTIIFNSSHQYELNDYNGNKPYFINMWFPITNETGNRIKYREYLTFDSIPEVQSLIDSIQRVQYNAFITWGVIFNLDVWGNSLFTLENINMAREMLDENLNVFNLDVWGNSSFTLEKQNMAREMLDENLNVFKTNQFPEQQFPTIIYHHGNGGISFENSVLFEFLASHGYVIISADYHWPGLRQWSYTHQSDLSLEDVDFVTKFSESLPFTNHQNLRYIGHSWGCGVALRLNQKGNPKFSHYIIFDSTLEKQGLLEFKDLNPHIDSLFRYHPNDFITRSTVITARASSLSDGIMVIQPYPEFLPFQLLDKSAFTFITLKQILNHGSFTSVEVMRATLLGQFEQSDSVTVKSQFETYQFLVQLTKDLIDGTEIDEEQILIQKD